MWAGISDGIRPKQRLSNTKKLFLAQEIVEIKIVEPQRLFEGAITTRWLYLSTLTYIAFTVSNVGDKILVYRHLVQPNIAVLIFNWLK